MPTTMCLYFRGDGATRALDAFRRALGAEAETLIVHPNRDDSGYYGSAEVLNVDAAREAFATARQPFPTLKAYLGVLPPEREQAAPRVEQGRGGEQRARVERPEARPSGGRSGEARAGNGGATRARGPEQSGPGEAARSVEQNGRKPPLRNRNRNERRPQQEREKPEQPSQGPSEG